MGVGGFGWPLPEQNPGYLPRHTTHPTGVASLTVRHVVGVATLDVAILIHVLLSGRSGLSEAIAVPPQSVLRVVLCPVGQRRERLHM